MSKWLEALRAIDKHDGNEPAKPAKVPFDPFAGSILEHSAREKTQADAVVEENDATNTSTNEPAKPAKGMRRRPDSKGLRPIQSTVFLHWSL